MIKKIVIISMIIGAFVVGDIVGYVGLNEGDTSSYWKGYNNGMDEGMEVTCEIIRECRYGNAPYMNEQFVMDICPELEDEYGNYCTMYINRHKEVLDDSMEVKADK